MADRSVKRGVDSTGGSSPAQAAGKRVRRPPAQTPLVTRRTSSRRSAVSRRSVVTPPPRKHVRKGSKADDDMSASEEHDDSDTDPAWMPDATKPVEEPVKKGKGARQKGVKKKVAEEDSVVEQTPPVTLSCDTEEVEEAPTKKDYTRQRKVPDTPPADVKVEGSFKTGDYIMAVADRNKASPPIWRIEGRSLLQRFEPYIKDGLLLHRNFSSFSAWNSLEQSKYTNIAVRIHSNSRSATVVQVLDLENKEKPEENKNGSRKIENLADKYQVYLQTLLSHVLDPSFLAEVHRENDEYFLNSLQAIDVENDHWRNNLSGTHRWSPELLEAVTSFPQVSLEEGKTAETPCQSCKGEGVSTECHFSGCRYGTLDLSKVEAQEEGPKEFLLCSLCVQPVECYSQLCHYKFHTFHKCKEKVEAVQKEGKLKESHIILEHCLQDDNWVNQMLSGLEKLWQSCS